MKRQESFATGRAKPAGRMLPVIRKTWRGWRRPTKAELDGLAQKAGDIAVRESKKELLSELDATQRMWGDAGKADAALQRLFDRMRQFVNAGMVSSRPIPPTVLSRMDTAIENVAGRFAMDAAGVPSPLRSSVKNKLRRLSRILLLSKSPQHGRSFEITAKELRRDIGVARATLLLVRFFRIRKRAYHQVMAEWNRLGFLSREITRENV